MRGSVTLWAKKDRQGFILGEDGCETYFDQASLYGLDERRLSVGDWVEFEAQFDGSRMRAVKIKPVAGVRPGHRL